MSVLTKVEPAKGIRIMIPAGELPIIHPPIVLPAPAPGEYRKSTGHGTLKWYWTSIRGGNWQYVRNMAKGQLAHKLFLFKMAHGLIRDDRSWLFKR